MKVPFSKVDCSGNELKYVKEVLESGWLTTASKAFEFENKFAEAVGAKFACAVNSGTAALHLAVESAGISEGTKVFVPAMTFTATAEVLRYMGADPVFLDVEFGSSLITPEILCDAIDKYPDVKYLMVVHYGGQSAKMVSDDADNINNICKDNGITIIEDAAHAFPTKCNGEFVGSWGNLTAFSFYANKTITTGEGGMITTNSEEFYNRMKTMRLHGINRDIWNRYKKSGSQWEYDVVAPGFKYNMPDLAAAVGLAQLERAFEMRDERERVVKKYLDRLKILEDVLTLPLVHEQSEYNSWHIFQVILKDSAPVSRNLLMEKLAEHGIGTSVHYKPLYRMSYYRETYKLPTSDFPGSESIWSGNLSLPLYPYMGENEIDYVCDSLVKLLRK